MFQLFPVSTFQEFVYFFLVMARMAGLLAAIPMFGGKLVPVRVKAALTLVMALLLFPVIRGSVGPLPLDPISLGLLVIRETLIGLSLGLVSQMITAAVEFCGQLVGMQMGISIAALFDPTQEIQVAVISVFQTLLAMLLFMVMGVHHQFLRSIVESYQVLPVGGWHMSGEMVQFLTSKVTGIFVIGVKLAAPVMVSLLATTVVLGMMARAFPQMNVFIISMPVNIGIGFLVLGMSLLVFMRTLGGAFASVDQQIKVLFKLLSS